MKYKEFHHTARHIDRLIDANIPAKGALPPFETLKNLILRSYPDLYLVNYGWHKIVFGNHAVDHKVVLKVGPKKSIENDHRAYKQVPESERHKYFARIYWHTKYCLLQEYGSPAKVSSEQLASLRRAVYKYGIYDVKADNLRVVDGEVKIIDVNITRILLPTVLRKIDELKPKLPKKLRLAIKKVTKKLNEK